MEKRIGIVGMGLMGQAFILNLRKSQFMIQGFDVDAKRMDDLRAQGGHPVDSPAAAAKGVDFVITSIPTSDIGRQVMLGAKAHAREPAMKMPMAVSITPRRPYISDSLP